MSSSIYWLLQAKAKVEADAESFRHMLRAASPFALTKIAQMLGYKITYKFLPIYPNFVTSSWSPEVN